MTTAFADKIHSLPNAREILDRIYPNWVSPYMELIQHSDNEAAYLKYRDYVQLLRGQYVSK